MSDKEETARVKENGYLLPKGYCWNPSPSSDIKNGTFYVMDTKKSFLLNYHIRITD